MNMKIIFTRSFILSFISALGFAAIAILIGEQRIAWLDDRLISLIQGWQSDALTSIMKFFTFIGSGLPVVMITAMIMIILYVGLKYRGELIFFTGVVVGSALLNTGLKLVFHRARPTLHRIVDANGFSFPSGHSMAAFSLYGVVCFLLWKHMGNAYARAALILIGCIMTVIIGVSRIYLGVHYPSDVIGGYLASGTWLAVSIYFYQRFLEKRTAKRGE